VACNEEIRKTAAAAATAIEENERSERKLVFMAPILTCVFRDSQCFAPPRLVRARELRTGLINPLTHDRRGVVLGNGLFKLLPTEQYDVDAEHWEFLPDSIVRAKKFGLLTEFICWPWLMKVPSTHLSDYPTSMIGLCQEGASSPDALGRSAGVNSFWFFAACGWPLGRGSYFR